MAEIAQYRGTGKRKTSVARVILRPGDGTTWINGRTLEDYFPRATHRTLALAPLKVADAEGRYDLRVRVARRRHQRTGRRGQARHRPRARRRRPRAPRPAQARGISHTRRTTGGAQEGRPAQGAQGTAVQQAVGAPPCGKCDEDARYDSGGRCPGGRSWGRDDRDARGGTATRRWFGTDGVRGVVDVALTEELVEQIGRAATLWSGRGRVLSAATRVGPARGSRRL